MESPSARAANSAMLLHHLDSIPPCGGVHRRRVSRTPQVQTEDIFYSARNAPPSPKATLDPHQSPTRSEWPPSATPRVANMEREQFDLGGAHQSPHRPAHTFTHMPQAQAQTHGSLNSYSQQQAGSTQLAVPPAQYRPSNMQGSPRAPKERRRRCAKCEREISGHFVRALGAAYHIQCFTCEDCGEECASKFFPMNDRPLCEHCYFKRQNLLCYRCNGSLRGSYITALDHKYHVEHFTCSLCPTVFGPDDSYFEHEGSVYCRIHYASLFAYRCEGCSSPILKQFVETLRGGRNLRWHPECYMIYKFWNVKVEDNDQEEIEKLRRQIADESQKPTTGEYSVAHPVLEDTRAKRVLSHEDDVEGLAMRIWTTLCGYEEACGDQISELVQAAVNGDFGKAYSHCTRFVVCVDVLFKALDLLPPVKHPLEVAGSGKEAKTLCRKVVSYMSLLSKTRQLSSRDRVAGLARDLLSLASAMAHYLKVLIRFGLSRALRSPGTISSMGDFKSRELLIRFLDAVAMYSSAEPAKPVSPFSSDRCGTCGKSVEDRCYRQKSRNDRLWHASPDCFSCSKCHTALDVDAAAISDAGHLFCLNCSSSPAQAFVKTTRLEQYVILLHVALARLDLVLSNHKRPQSQQAAQTQRLPQPRQTDHNSASTPILPGQRATHAESPLSDAPAAQTADTVPSTLERTSTILHSKRGLTLDDIRRIVATEQAHSAEQKRAKSPNTRSQQSKQPPQQSKRGLEVSRPNLQSYPSTSVLPNGKKSPNKDHFFGRLDDEDYLWVQYIAQALMQQVSKDILHVEFEAVEFGSPAGASVVAETPVSSGKQGGSGQSVPGASIWERMGKVFTGASKSSTDIPETDGVFGQPLERVTVRHGVESSLGVPETGGEYTLRVPSFVDDCIGAMRQKDMSVEGVFRKNGNIRRLREFVEKIDKFPDENGLLVDESPIQLAALLKKFLRDLPDPLLTSRMTRLWIAVSRVDAEKQAKIVPLLISLLPRVNRNVLETLVHFLNWVSGFAQVEEDVGSKMDIANLATVFTPTLVLSSEEAASTALLPGQVDAAEEPELGENSGTHRSSSDGYKHTTEVVKLLIQEYTLVAQVPLDVLYYLRRMKQLKLSPRRLSIKELNELMKQ